MMFFRKSNLLRLDLLEHHVEGALSSGELQRGVLTGVAEVETISFHIGGSNGISRDVGSGGEVLVLGSGNAISQIQQRLGSIVAVELLDVRNSVSELLISCALAALYSVVD